MGFGTIIKFIAGAYVLLVALVVYNLTRPVTCNPQTHDCVSPAFTPDQKFDLLIYTSEFPTLGKNPRFPTDKDDNQKCEILSSGDPGDQSGCISTFRPSVGEDLQLVWSVRNLSCSSAESFTALVNISENHRAFRNNGSLYAHVLITRPNTPPSPFKTTSQSYVVTPLTTHMPPVVRNRTMLIEDLSATAPPTSTAKQVLQLLGATLGSVLILSASYFLHHPRYGGWSYVVLACTTCLVFLYTILIRFKQGHIDPGTGVIFSKSGPAVTHWKGSLNLDLVTELSTVGLRNQAYPDLLTLMQQYSYIREPEYSLMLSSEDFSLVRRYFTRVTHNSTTELEISFRPRSIFMFRGLHMIESQLKENIRMGLFTEHDFDDLRLFFSKQKLWVLVLTYVISLLHMIFDFLAFKNDVGFYRTRKDFTGLSSRAIISSFMCSLIVYLYLVDNEMTSSLILLSTGAGCLIELWKIKRILKVELRSEWPYVTNAIASAEEQRTDRFDVVAMGYLGMLLYPIVLAMAVWSLIYHPQKSWWSWAIGSLAYGVYVFGFIMMTPQLFINYQLKSVAHMPWRVLMYKAFNTFIDDVFSFVIAMPMAHRIACLRDDLVFFVYLYQRWCFPVDKTRPNEYGMIFEEPAPPNATLPNDSAHPTSPDPVSGNDLRQRQTTQAS